VTGGAPVATLDRPGPSRAPRHEREPLFLHAGRSFVSSRPSAVTTVVGSCVAVCLWVPRLRLGGVTHFVLPHGPGTSRFGNVAVLELVKQVGALAGRGAHVQAKVFGGSRSVDEPDRTEGRPLGAQNVATALRILSEQDITVVAEDVGGDRGRRVTFHTDTGAARVRLV